MLLLRVIVTLGACWIVKCDLLDLYVQHMDETMRTMVYRSKRHPRDPASRIKRSLGLDETEPVFRLGNYKKQRLDVDEEWMKDWKTKKNIFYKKDALDFPNEREENLDPDQHETLYDTTQHSRDSGEKTANPEDVTEANSPIDIEIVKLNVTKDEVESGITQDPIIDGGKEELEEESETWWSSVPKETDDLEEPAVESFEFSARDDRKDTGTSSNHEENSQFEIISENERIDPRPFDDPSLKSTPKLRSRAPKKYFPFAEKPAKDASRHETTSRSYVKDEATNGRSKRSAKEPVFTRYEKLDENGDVVLEWDPSDDEEVVFRVTARTLGYVGIGFNEKSHMKGADILLAWVDDHTGAVNLLDSHGVEQNAAPVTDMFQDVRVLNGSQNETHTTVVFSRNWETCDPQDHRLTGDTIRVLWALHQTDPELNTAIWHGEKRGGTALRLRTAAAHSPPRETEGTRKWDVKLSQYAVSDNMDTVYWCKIFQAPQLNEKYHMIGYTPLVEKANEDLVHHVILYECASLPVLAKHARIAGAFCYSPTMPQEWETCMQPVLAWARGSKGEWLPEHVGIPIAEHREGTYYMLEVHYNNPTMRKVIDSSGVRLHLTSKLRPQEAGILVAGVAVSPFHMVPPQQKEYATAGYCTPHCTNKMFPEDGINVISVVLHSHLAGRRLSLKHIREGKELPRIVQDNHFDFDYQQSHTLEKEVKVLPGDELVAECVYGTLDRKRPTLGGYAASQEMCLAFVMHYPRTPLAACYSMTPVKDLFKTLGVYSFKGMTMDHLEKLYLTTGTDSMTLPSANQQQLIAYPTAELDETLVKVLRAMKDYTEERDNDNVFERLVIEEPPEFRGRTLAQHMQSMPWTEELLTKRIENTLYHGRHMTFCRKRDDKLALPANIQNFPNYTALPEANDTTCSDLRMKSGCSGIARVFAIHVLVTCIVVLSVVVL